MKKKQNRIAEMSKTKLRWRTRRKTSPAMKEVCLEAMRKPEWREVAKILSSSTRKQTSLNLFQIDAETKDGDTAVIIGKVLSKGELTKKIRICALSISESAREKLGKTKSEFLNLF
ncbi:MAG: uL15 family ribosomal protein [Nanoarchaeota archaeon]